MKKKTLFIIVIVFLLATIPLAVFLVKKQQDIRMRAEASTTLAINPPSVTKNINESFTLQVVINTGPNNVVAADLDINFNSQILEAISIFPGEFFTSPNEANKTINNTTGRILYALTSFAPQTGNGNLASIVFKVKGEGTSSISFGSQTGVYTSGGENVLQSSSSGTVIAVSGETTSTSTPTPILPTETATVTPTSIFTTTPTLIPIFTPTPVPTVTLTPGSPTPTLSSGTATPTLLSSVGGSFTFTPTATLKLNDNSNSTSSSLPSAGVNLPTLISIFLGFLFLTSAFVLLI